MYEYYFGTVSDDPPAEGGVLPPSTGVFDVITANRYNVVGPDAFVSGW